MTSKKTAQLRVIIDQLLQTKPAITLHDIAQKAKLDAHNAANRKSIQRVLSDLIASNHIEAIGQARARQYIKKTTTPIPITKIIPYRTNFLASYLPNKTNYLPPSLQQRFLEIGSAEPTPQPAGTYARKILDRLLIDLSWNSSRLEGNTYSLLETKALIEHHKSAPNKDPAETQMILNHKAAIEFIIEIASEKNISAYDVRSIHALLSENLLGDPGASGRIRNIMVHITGTNYVPIDNPHLLTEYFDLFITKLNGIHNPFEQSFFALVHLSYLQAFEDVNKRTSRLVANLPLVKNNLNPLSFVGVNQDIYVSALLKVYEHNEIDDLRDLYWEAYQQSAEQYSAIQKKLNAPDPIKLIYRDEIHKIIRDIIQMPMSGTKTTSYIKNQVNKLNCTQNEKEKLIQIIETEIACLHEGNIARFKIRPSEFDAWRKYFS